MREGIIRVEIPIMCGSCKFCVDKQEFRNGRLVLSDMCQLLHEEVSKNGIYANCPIEPVQYISAEMTVTDEALFNIPEEGVKKRIINGIATQLCYQAIKKQLIMFSEENLRTFTHKYSGVLHVVLPRKGKSYLPLEKEE